MESGERNEEKTKVVVVMGATGSGKSRLAIDLAAYFPVEVINADAMQIYRGLDVLTNKVPLQDRCGVPHHLLGTADTGVDFTSRDFRTLAIRNIDDVSSRGCLPVVVGGTNYYIQRWGRTDNFRYDCCFIWVDASLPELDRYVGERVDSMMEAGLLDEVYYIYDPDADYTRGLKQAIGVREFEKFFSSLLSSSEKDHQSINDEVSGGSIKSSSMMSGHEGNYQLSKIDLLRRIQDSDNSNLKILLNEAIDELKANTRRLVRRQVSSTADTTSILHQYFSNTLLLSF
ncbi:unnamed protein product [Spirodela intermedia]|uniref:Uncharacterized protein n=2 Tax=Spirodela intermedia TaxID=51605 RepID=A0A7I8IRZ1_SPIIN|nr:unnamed protein product [Spirodela intermedia]CAA6660722.1 unnamed protein product [Spirodela intermedia]CAA7397090.1 unnamed protein product [Spirodela intermedia]